MVGRKDLSLAQTNLQLHQQLISDGADDQDIATVERAYELTINLFPSTYRPSGKAFISHLIGVASALRSWNQPLPVVMSGLLHSAYLYGEFGDRTRGFSFAKQATLKRELGDTTEALIREYTRLDNICLLDGSQGDEIEDIHIMLRLADLLDECMDGGPCFARHKPLPMNMPFDMESRSVILDLADRLAGPTGIAQFESAFRFCDLTRERSVPTSTVRGSQVKSAGLPGFRPNLLRLVKRRLRRTLRRLQKICL